MKKIYFSILRQFSAIFLSISLILFNSLSYAAPFAPQADPSAISIPEQLGKIEEAVANQPKTILYIQDAHDSLEAQENIAKIINFAVEHYGVRTVYEEGYEGLVPTDKYFGLIKDRKSREKIAYFLMDKLRIGGAEYAHINRKTDFHLIGADSQKLHFVNVNQYRKSAKLRQQIQRDLEAMKKEVLNLANQFFPKDLKEWMKIRARLDTNEINLLDYLERLQSLLPQSFSTQERYPNVSLLLAFAHSSVTTEKIQAIDSKILFQEIDRLEDDYANSQLTNARDQKIFHYYKGLKILERLNAIELSASEFEAVKSSLAELSTEKIVHFIAQNIKKTTLFSRKWEHDIQEAIKFYEIAHERNNSIEAKLQTFLESPKENIAILVFGGFHQEGIKELLKKHRLSYQIITPKIQQIDERHRSYYRELMAIGHHSFEVPTNLRLASRPIIEVDRWESNPALARVELRTMEKVAIQTDGQEFSIWGKEMEKQLATLRKEVLENKRSEMRSWFKPEVILIEDKGKEQQRKRTITRLNKKYGLDWRYQWESKIKPIKDDFEELLLNYDLSVPEKSNLLGNITDAHHAKSLIYLIDAMSANLGEITKVLEALTPETSEQWEIRLPDISLTAFNVSSYWNPDIPIPLEERIKISLSTLSGNSSEKLEFVKDLAKLRTSDRNKIKKSILRLRAQHEEIIQWHLLNRFSSIDSFVVYHGSRAKDFYRGPQMDLKDPTFFGFDKKYASIYLQGAGEIFKVKVPLESIVDFLFSSRDSEEEGNDTEIVVREGKYEIVPLDSSFQQWNENGLRRRSELRLADNSFSKSGVYNLLERLTGRHTIFVDLDDIEELTLNQLIEDYEKVGLKYKGVSFVFYNDRHILFADKRDVLERMQQQLGHNRVVISPDQAGSIFRQYGGRGKAIHISKKSRKQIEENVMRWVPRKKDFIFFEYLGDETGVVPVALLYANANIAGMAGKRFNLSMVDQQLVAVVRDYFNNLLLGRSA